MLFNFLRFRYNGPMGALIELLALVALVVTIVAGLLQIADWVGKRTKKPGNE